MQERKHSKLLRLLLVLTAVFWLVPQGLAQSRGERPQGPAIRTQPNSQRMLKEKFAAHAKRKAAAQRLKAKIEAARAAQAQRQGG